MKRGVDNDPQSPSIIPEDKIQEKLKETSVYNRFANLAKKRKLEEKTESKAAVSAKVEEFKKEQPAQRLAKPADTVKNDLPPP